MNIIQIKLSNFLSHKNTLVDFPDGLTGVLGLNGSGKSSLIADSITWALWGKSRATGAGDDLIFYNESKCSVCIKFEINGQIYRVQRIRNYDKKTELELLKYDRLQEVFEDAAGVTLKDTQSKIDSILGTTYEIFKNTCYVEQGDIHSFSQLTPAQASELLSDILQLTKYVDYHDKAALSFMQSKSESVTVEATIESLNQQLQHVSDVEQLKDIELKKIAQMESAYAIQKSKFDKTQAQSNKLSQKFESRQDYLKQLKTELSYVEKDLLKLGKQSEFVGKINGKCPVCQSELSEMKKKEVKDHITLDHTSAVTKKELMESQIKDLESKLRDTFNEVKALKLDEKSRQLNAAEQNIVCAKARIEAAGQVVNSSHKELSVKLTQEQARLEVLQVQQTIYSELTAAFGNKGIPLLIIDSVLKELKILINDNLSLLSDTPIVVDISTQRESSTGKTIDTFQILIQDGLRTVPYHNYSGGERTIIDLSIRLGLSELLARRNNFKIETLFIDEGLSALDDVNQNNFIKTLNRLTSKFKKIIVITHTQLKDYFNQCIEVTKKDKISQVDFYPKMCYNSK